MPSRWTGRDAFLDLLADEGVDHLFGNPGTTELAIMAALGKRTDIRFVLGLQEAIVVAMADGFARASGRLVACNVHVAPGLGNALGSLYNAQFCGSPILLTAGQQEQGHGLMEPLLYAPLVPLAQPLVKWAVEVTRVEDLPRVIRRAAKVATTPPTGPVFISLPGDVLDGEAETDRLARSRVDAATRPSAAAIEALARRLLAAERPVLVAGTDVAAGNAWAQAAALAELLGAPVYQQTVPDAAHFPTDHRAFLGILPRDQRRVRELLAPYDLLCALGGEPLRMSVYSPVGALPPGLPVVQIGQRDWDLAKNYPAEIALRADLGATLTALLDALGRLITPARRARAEASLAALAERNWTARRGELAREAQTAASARPIDPRYLMYRLSERLPASAVVVEEALTATASLLAFLHRRDPRSLMGLASGGIGFAMGGAVGASLALPDRPVVAVVGDGSAMYSIQALWTAAHLKLPITYVILNNRGYRILKERLVSMRGTHAFVGMDFHDPPIDFTALATAMGVSAQRVSDPREIDAALAGISTRGGPRLLEFMVADGFGG
jgi:benzoylformate decarboxylase